MGSAVMEPIQGVPATAGRLRREPTALDRRAAAVLARVHGGQAINNGDGMIKLETACLASAFGATRVSVEVNWSMVLAKAVAHLYLIADGNREPLLARVPLIPDLVPPHVCIDVRLEQSCHVRAVVECGDGALLEVKRWVWVMPSEG